MQETNTSLPCLMNGNGDPVHEQGLISRIQNVGDQMAFFRSRCEMFNRTVNLLKVIRKSKILVGYTK